MAFSLRLGLWLVVVVLQQYTFRTAIAQPSPGYYPSSKFKTIGFKDGFDILWGSSHHSLSSDRSLTIWLDRDSGSGFKSTRPFRNGYFGASIKLQSGYTAGVITSLYLSNNQAHPGAHDEVDIEFLGTTPGKPYTLQTNVYVRGSGDGPRIIGREMRFHLWFDPTADFHNYGILWDPNQIIFYVDDVPVRSYPKKTDSSFPRRPMWVYGSIWDASSWATEGGLYKADYSHAPFIAKYTRFVTNGCSAYAPLKCRPVPASPSGNWLSAQQVAAMKWVQTYHMVYYYCRDRSRDHRLTPECSV